MKRENPELLYAILNSFDIWCLRKILRIPHTRHVTNADSLRLSIPLQVGLVEIKAAVSSLVSHQSVLSHGESSQGCRGSASETIRANGSGVAFGQRFFNWLHASKIQAAESYTELCLREVVSTATLLGVSYASE